MKQMIAMAALVAAVVLAPTAHADDLDGQFLAQARADGALGSDEQLIDFAHTMCGVVGSMAAAPPQYGLAGSTGMPMWTVAQVMIDGVKVYCPDKMSVIPQNPNVHR